MSNDKEERSAPFTDDDIEQWASKAESEQGYTGKHLGPSVPSRPVSAGGGAPRRAAGS